MEDEARRDVGLFRYSLIRPALDAQLSRAERGRLVAEVVGRDHLGPGGRRVGVARSTLYRWLKDYRDGGFDALVPAPRALRLRSDAELLDLAVRLKREHPTRAAAHIRELIATELAARDDDRRVPSARTVQRHFARLGLNRHPAGPAPQAFGRFEAERRNHRWIGDGMHGPMIGAGRAVLLAFVDDHSRLIPGHHWGRAEDSVRLEAALRRGLAARGIPKVIYVDNGSAWVAAPLHRACAVLGIHLVHATPGRAEGRGKIERFFRTVRSQFLIEVAARGVADLDELRALFVAWLEQRYHRRVHSETGQTPLERFETDATPELPGPELLREAFLWSARRMVTKTATVSFQGNRYEVDHALVGRTVELVFDPFDLTRIEVRWNHTAMGLALPHELATNVHPKIAGRRGDHDADDTPAPTGIDYLALVEQEHRDATSRAINFTDLDRPDHDSDRGDRPQEDPP